MTEVEIFRQSLEVSRVVMIITIIMTLISVTFSALTLAFQRSHDIKTVKPLCSVTIRRAGKLFQVILKNAGLGPMIVTDIRIDVAGADRQDKFKKMILSANEEAAVFESGVIAPGSKITIEYRDLYDKEHTVTENLETY